MKPTILIIDDDPVDIKALGLLIKGWGYTVLSARSGDAGLDVLRERSVDLVLSDVRMPGKTGEDVVRELQTMPQAPPIILLTAFGDIRSAVDAMKLGAFDYVVKPPHEEELKLTIERAVEHAGLRRENAFLRAEMGSLGIHGQRIVGSSEAMLDVYNLIDRVAPTDSTVLITGETGTGKELVAQTIHFRSKRADKPMVALNCAALNENLLESELFGHEKGAFTGAVGIRRGRFEAADGGTLFLDEVAETSPEFQSKLLRALQEGCFERVGGNHAIEVDVRVVASTNRDLKQEIAAGRFREDLYYRLSVIPVSLPPLRERGGDISLLATYFLSQYAERYNPEVKAITDDGLRALEAHEWPGNVRELRHAIERAVVLGSGPQLTAADVSPERAAEPATSPSGSLADHVEQATRDCVLAALDANGWKKQHTAVQLGIDRATLYRLLKKYSIR